ncbi:MAG TPA: hypothetical protein VFM92_10285 [Marivirga sp.]|nr:hypothetical protein [Marivirga sp.]
MVVIIDGTNLGRTNIQEEIEEIDHGECGVFVENLTVHLLVKGCHFNLKTKSLAIPEKSSEKEKDS